MNATPDITIVGLGPGDREWRTVGVQAALDVATRIFVRTHPGVDLGDLVSRGNVTDVAGLRQPDAVPGGRWHAATLAICHAAADGPVVLAIPGHPRFGEGLVREVLHDASRRGLPARVLDGISVVDLIATALDMDPLLEGAQLFNARQVAESASAEPFDGGMFTGSPRRPMLFTHVYDATIIHGVTRALGRILPLDHPVTRIDAAGMPDERISQHAVEELANVPAGPLVALWVPAQDELEAVRDPRTLQHLVARLRAPDGCPWDRKQTIASLCGLLIDELYEAVDAIEAGDLPNLAEELGDLTLLIAMLSQIAHESGAFSLEDVWHGVTTKIVRRHPHVFGDVVATEAEDVLGVWAAAKDRERATNPSLKRAKDPDGEPRAMPALERANRVLRKHPIASEPFAGDHDAAGDMLLALVASLCSSGIDPDRALRSALNRHVTTADPRHQGDAS